MPWRSIGRLEINRGPPCPGHPACGHGLQATPALETGTNIAFSEIASVRLYGKAGVAFSDKGREIEGRFAAAENLPGNLALHLTDATDSPLYRVGAGLELNGTGMSARDNGAFGENGQNRMQSARLSSSVSRLARGGAGRERS